MECATCGKVNRDGARFCSKCGGPLVPRCPQCGNEVEPDAGFCDTCGAPVGDTAPAPAETRKVVTVVFADLAGSTSLHERLDAESVRRVMERYYAALRAVVEEHDGTVVKLMGDGVMAAFGVPKVREDDALRAVRAGVAMQASFADLANELTDRVGALALRVGVNSGEVVVRDDDRDIVGHRRRELQREAAVRRRLLPVERAPLVVEIGSEQQSHTHTGRAARLETHPGWIEGSATIAKSW
jgi:Adenylate and Guanylate cyclase catalytic domain/Double zinc ribbon